MILIYADPPWPENKTGGKRTGASRHFNTMSAEDLRRLPIAEMTNRENAVLYLWTTARHPPLAYEVMKAWGFDPVTIGFTWIKTTRDGQELIYSTGQYTAPNPEFCLIGRRGSYVQPASFEKSVITAPRQRFATKPEEARQRLDRMYPHALKIELFAREQSPGWCCLGDAVDGLDIQESIERWTRSYRPTP